MVVFPALTLTVAMAALIDLRKKASISKTIDLIHIKKELAESTLFI